MSDKEAPKIEFPCADYPIKVIGHSSEGFRDMVTELVQKHAPEVKLEAVTEQPSRNGKFLSIRFRIIATGPTQLKALHQDLMASGRVTMVI